MGYSTRPGTSIVDFSPDDTDAEFYIEYGASFDELTSRIQQKWPDVSMSDIRVDAEWIHTSCLHYDQYDAGDYTQYLVIRRNTP